MLRSRRFGVLSLVLAAALVGALIWWLTRPAVGEQVDLRPASGVRSDVEALRPESDVSGAAAVPEIPPVPPRGAAVSLEPDESSTSASAASASAATTGSLLVQVLWKAGGTPAPDIGLRLLQLDRPDPQFHATLGRSDADGRWLLDGLRPGRVIVYSDRIEAAAGWVVAGQALELALELLPGVLVRGTVVDPDQRAVPDAEIWLDGHNSPGAIMPVARTDNAGRFAVRDVRHGQSVGASAPGHTRSCSVIVSKSVPEPFEVTIELGTPGGRVQGVVVDPQGRPVAGATVLLGGQAGWPTCEASSPFEQRGLPPFRLLTDERGAFVADDVPARPVEVRVRATGWSPWSGFVIAQAGETAVVDVRLQTSAAVSGVVRDEAGLPVADVHVGTEESDEMARQYAFSAADGRFTLRDVLLGRTALEAYKDHAGRAKTSLTIEPGETHTWDPVLSSGLRILGRVVDGQGRPVAGCDIRAQPEGGGEVREARTDRDGRFTLDHCADATHRLDAEAPGSSSPFAVVTLTGIRPGPDELEIVADESAESAVVLGRVQDAQGLPLVARLLLEQPATARMLGAATDAATGAFRLGPLPAGRYTLEAEVEGLSRLSLPEFDLAAGETRDVGTLVFETPGTLRVRARLPVGVDAASLAGFVFGRQAGAQLELQADGTLTSPPLQPGDYRIRVLALGASTPDQSVRIESGRQAEVDVTLSACLWLQVHLSMPLRDGPPPIVSLKLADPAGTIVIEERGPLPVQPDEPWRRDVVGGCLPPATYDLEVRVDDRLVLHEPIRMDTGESAYVSKFELP